MSDMVEKPKTGFSHHDCYYSSFLAKNLFKSLLKINMCNGLKNCNEISKDITSYLKNHIFISVSFLLEAIFCPNSCERPKS